MHDADLTAADLALLNADPSAARLRFGAHRDAPPEEPLRLAYEMAAWMSGPTVPSYVDHLRVMGVDVADRGVRAAHLDLASSAADGDRGALAAFWFAAWLAGEAPHRLTERESAVAVAVYRALLATGSGHEESMMRAVLRVDPEAAEIARELVGSFLAADIVAFLREIRARHPRVSWVAEIARELPELATVGDLADEATRALLVDAMVELGGVPRDEAAAQLPARHGQ